VVDCSCETAREVGARGLDVHFIALLTHVHDPLQRLEEERPGEFQDASGHAVLGTLARGTEHELGVDRGGDPLPTAIAIHGRHFVQALESGSFFDVR